MRTLDHKVAHRLVRQAIDSGFFCSVYDSCFGDGDWTLTRSRKVADVLGALGTTDGDTLLLRNPDGTKFASLTLIYGNDPDELIADYSSADLDAVAEWLKPVGAYAETLRPRGRR